MTLGLIDILRLAGFDPKVPTKLVRHQDRRYPVVELRRHNWLELYQSYQSKPKFHSAKQIVSFYGLHGTRAGFYGVYNVLGHQAHQPREGPIMASCDWSSEWNRDARFSYDLQRDPRFDDFRDRIVIDWGPGTLAWVQDLVDKPVLQILEPGRGLPPFEDYLEFSLKYDQLKGLFRNEDAHQDWKAHLSAVGGVYLILAEGTGDLYVGSASGVEGIWGRWRDYAKSEHGGNVQLRKLIQSDSSYPHAFRFSLLQILPKTTVKKELIQHEERYKQKLGTRAKGLN